MPWTARSDVHESGSRVRSPSRFSLATDHRPLSTDFRLPNVVCHGQREAMSVHPAQPSIKLGTRNSQLNCGSRVRSPSRSIENGVPWAARSDVRASRPAIHQTRHSELATRNSIAAREYARPPVFSLATDHRRPTSAFARAPRLEQQRPVSIKETGHRTPSKTRITSFCGRPPERLPPWECIRVPARVRTAWGR